MRNAMKVRWDSEKDAWLVARLYKQSYINWTAVSDEFHKAFNVCYPVGQLMKRWRELKCQIGFDIQKRRGGRCYGITLDSSHRSEC